MRIERNCKSTLNAVLYRLKPVALVNGRDEKYTRLVPTNGHATPATRNVAREIEKKKDDSSDGEKVQKQRFF